MGVDVESHCNDQVKNSLKAVFMVKGFKWIRVGTQKMCCGVWCAGVSGLWGVVLSHKLRWTGTNRSKRVVKLQQTTRNRRPENQKHLFESQHDFIEEKLPARCWFPASYSGKTTSYCSTLPILRIIDSNVYPLQSRHLHAHALLGDP